MTRNSTYHTVRILGGLLPADLLERVGAQDPDLESSSPVDYDLAPGERLGEAITRSWNRLQPLWERFSERPEQAGALTGPTRQEWLLPLFQELGFGHLSTAPGLEIESKAYPISHIWESTPIHLVGVGVDLDRRIPGVAGAASASPHGLVQEFLNRSDDHLWGIVSNGYQLRLLRDNASLTRTAYVEFDLRELFEGDSYSNFALLWLTCHASRLEGPASKEVLERWREDAATSGIRALDALRDGVEAAIETLGSAAVGHPDNVALRQRLDDGTLDVQDLYRQILRVVYRFLFLFVAETRNLLLDPKADPAVRTRYLRYYSITRLRDLAVTTRGGLHGDLWIQHSIVARALEAKSEPALGLLPLGGFLWSSETTSALNDVTVSNEALLTAIRSLTMVRPRGELPQRVDYANLGAEELGSVYESLLEYVPEVNPVAGSFKLKGAVGNERKTTGSYYTPSSLINELLDSALDPVIDRAAHAQNPEEAILNLKVVDPAAGSGHFLLAAANRMADRLARVRIEDGEPSPEQLSTALRDVIGHCVYAVDINPMAVELAKVALWIEAMEPGKPLTFLDHHIVCGNSLLGVTPKLLEGGVPGEAYKALTGDDKDTVKALKARNNQEQKKNLVALTFGATPQDLLQHAADELDAIDHLDNDSPDGIAEKQRRYQQLIDSAEQRRLRLAADAWIAAFVAPKTKDSPQITTAVVNAVLHDPDSIPDVLASQITDIAQQFRFHHWHLAFPDVFTTCSNVNKTTGWGGGFDVILGNPPWEQTEVNADEFFAVAAPAIAEMDSGAARDMAIEQLRVSEPRLHERYLAALRLGSALNNYYRNSGRFPLSGTGRVNTAALFVEGFCQVRAPAGSAGLIVPSSIFTDRHRNTAPLVSDLITSGILARVIDYENRGRFPAVDSRMQVSCVTIAATDYGLTQIRTESAGSVGDSYTLSTAQLAALNPSLSSIPLFSSMAEKDLTIGLYHRFPNLREGWTATASSVYHMTNDRKAGHFVDDAGSEDGLLRLFESKMIESFNHRAGDVYISSTARKRRAQSRSLTTDELRDQNREARPQYWVRTDECERRLHSRGHKFRWTLVWKNVSSATNTRTLVPCIVPGGASGHSLWTLFLDTGTIEDFLSLLGLLGSVTTDYLVRSQLSGNNVSSDLVLNLPLPTPRDVAATCLWDASVTNAQWLAYRSLELSACSRALSSLSEGLLGIPRVFAWDPRRRLELKAELSAAAAILYGLSSEESTLIRENFATTDSRSLRELLTLSADVEQRIRVSVETGEPYQTILDPPPADPSLACERAGEGQ